MIDSLETVLVESAQNGDIDSFGELCKRYYGSMAAIAYSALGDHHLAEDAAQETFARAIVNLRKLRQKDKFAPWLARICRNVAKDMAKAESRQFSTDDLSQVPADDDADNHDQALRETVNRLPASARELIVLRYYNNLSYRQMSAILGISTPAVNGRLNRAKRKIAKYLSSNGFSEVQL